MVSKVLRRSRLHSAFILIVFLVTCLAVGWIGSQFRPGDWYEQLAKPAWRPPNAVFAPVWTILYFTMGLAAWLVWRQSGLKESSPALGLFAFQLLLNAAWSLIFFGLHRPGLAFGEILLLWGAILGTLLAFWRKRPLAGILLVPYLLWVSFAAALNFSIWRLNS